jgi:hypothetical protein
MLWFTYRTEVILHIFFDIAEILKEMKFPWQQSHEETMFCCVIDTQKFIQTIYLITEQVLNDTWNGLSSELLKTNWLTHSLFNVRVSQDFRPLVIFINQTHLGPWLRGEGCFASGIIFTKISDKQRISTVSMTMQRSSPLCQLKFFLKSPKKVAKVFEKTPLKSFKYWNIFVKEFREAVPLKRQIFDSKSIYFF